MRDILRWLGEWVEKRHGLAVCVVGDDAAEVESREVRGLLFHTVRELLFNVVKHAQVKEAAIRVGRKDDRLELVVMDDGIGFDPAGGGQDGVGGGFGLFSIRERLELLGGELQIDSAAGRGTRMTIVTPVRMPDEVGGHPAEAAGE